MNPFLRRHEGAGLVERSGKGGKGGWRVTARGLEVLAEYERVEGEYGEGSFFPRRLLAAEKLAMRSPEARRVLAEVAAA